MKICRAQVSDGRRTPNCLTFVKPTAIAYQNSEALANFWPACNSGPSYQCQAITRASMIPLAGWKVSSRSRRRQWHSVVTWSRDPWQLSSLASFNGWGGGNAFKVKSQNFRTQPTACRKNRPATLRWNRRLPRLSLRLSRLETGCGSSRGLRACFSWQVKVTVINCSKGSCHTVPDSCPSAKIVEHHLICFTLLLPALACEFVPQAALQWCGSWIIFTNLGLARRAERF